VAAKTVVVLDYGSGNLRSVQRALARAGAEVSVTADLGAAAAADGVVVPGVGAFAACMAGLEQVSGPTVLRDRVASGAPVLGICVGMQVLFTAGTEHGLTSEGIGLWPGTVDQLDAPVLPHMGWDTVAVDPASSLLAGLEEERFYFVHSYAARHAPQRPDGGVASVSWSHHGEDFVAVVEDGPLAATQFHPEKSADAGAELLHRWVVAL